MTDLLLRYPMEAFLVGLVVLAVNVGWCLYLIVETIKTHRNWKEGSRN